MSMYTFLAIDDENTLILSQKFQIFILKKNLTTIKEEITIYKLKDIVTEHLKAGGKAFSFIFTVAVLFIFFFVV